MGITSVEARKTNPNNEIVTVHNDVNFLVDVYYSGTEQRILTASISGDTQNNLGGDQYPIYLGKFYPTVYEKSFGKTTYIFNGGNILKSFLYDFSDTFSEEKVIEFLPNMSRNIVIDFSIGGKRDILYVTLLNASSQIGSDYLDLSKYFEQTVNYYGGEEMPVYIYFYNKDVNATISIEDPTLPSVIELYAFDYDDAVFMDYDDYYFTIEVELPDGNLLIDENDNYIMDIDNNFIEV